MRDLFYKKIDDIQDEDSQGSSSELHMHVKTFSYISLD